MKDLSEEKSALIRGGTFQSMADCGYNIAMSAAVGGLFSGAGAVIGAAVAASGPSCMGWW